MTPIGPHTEQGRCGACTRPARRFPSGRWEHHGRPCALRSQGMSRPGDLPLPPVEFVPDGDELPAASQPATVVHYDDPHDTRVPTSIGWVPPEQVTAYWARVREQLRAAAEDHTEHDGTDVRASPPHPG